jgi:hypothetical protein
MSSVDTTALHRRLRELARIAQDRAQEVTQHDAEYGVLAWYGLRS